MRTCNRCGAEELLAEPFIEGTCTACHRKASPQKPPPPPVAPPVAKPATAPPTLPPFHGTDWRRVLAGFEIIVGTLVWLYYWNVYDATVETGSGRVYNNGLQMYQLLGFIFGLWMVTMAHLTLLLSRPRQA